MLIPGAPLGTITTLVQALAGLLLAVTLVLLLMLCNDPELLGPLTNSFRLNFAADRAVGLILGFSTMLTITIVRPLLRVTLMMIALLLANAGSFIAS